MTSVTFRKPRTSFFLEITVYCSLLQLSTRCLPLIQPIQEFAAYLSNLLIECRVVDIWHAGNTFLLFYGSGLGVL